MPQVVNRGVDQAVSFGMVFAGQGSQSVGMQNALAEAKIKSKNRKRQSTANTSQRCDSRAGGLLASFKVSIVWAIQTALPIGLS